MTNRKEEEDNIIRLFQEQVEGSNQLLQKIEARFKNIPSNEATPNLSKFDSNDFNNLYNNT